MYTIMHWFREVTPALTQMKWKTASSQAHGEKLLILVFAMHVSTYNVYIHSPLREWVIHFWCIFPNQFHHSVAGEHCMESKVEERDFWLHFSLLSWMQVYMDYESPSISYSISSLIQPLVSSFLVFCISPSHACIQVYFIARCSMFFTYA